MNSIVDENSFDLLIDNNLVEEYRAVAKDQIFQIDPKMSLVVLNAIDFDMCDMGTLRYSFFPSLMTLDSDAADSSNVGKIQNNPNFSLYGQGVLVGVIDTGIDYRHKAFRFSDGTSRIHSIWDQTIITEGKEPQGLPYGTEYTKSEINTALLAENPLDIIPSNDEIGHGTKIAGIIAGSYDKANNFQGIVPQSEIIAVKLKQAKKYNKQIFCVPEDKLCYEETDLIAGITYITEKAKSLHRPLALCIGIGTSQGDHCGRGSTSNYLNYVTQTPGIGVSVSGGNEGNNRRHYYGHTNGVEVSELELNVDQKDTSFSMEIWVSAPFRLTMDIISPTGENITDIYPRIGSCRKLDFIFTPSIVYVNNIISENLTGDQLILIRFVTSYSGIWKFRLSNIDEMTASFHAWLPSNHLISNDTFFLNPDPDTTLTSPGNAESPLVVANYNQQSASISTNSSRGYTRYNRIKPDIAAPGVNILCPVPNDKYTYTSGTSASAAHAAGLIAMLLEWAVVKGNYTNISGAEINKMIIRGARRKENLEYPNKIWGYGVTDIFSLFEKLI